MAPDYGTYSPCYCDITYCEHSSGTSDTYVTLDRSYTSYYIDVAPEDDSVNILTKKERREASLAGIESLPQPRPMPEAILSRPRVDFQARRV